MTAADNAVSLPCERPELLGIPPALLELQRERPVAVARTPAGHQAWLCTRYEDVKTLLGDDRLGRSHPDPEKAPRYSTAAFAGGPMGNWETEAEDHSSWRQLLAPAFSARRMKLMRSTIQELADNLFDQMSSMAPPVDFHDLVSFPLPVQVICGLLGVPPGRGDQLHLWCEATTAFYDPQKAADGLASLRDYMRQLVQAKREDPGEDVISDLVNAGPGDPKLQQRAVRLAASLLFGGHESTVAMIDFGLLHLLTRPSLRDAMLGDPSIVASTVEEILRCSLPFAQDVLVRYARTDLEIAGVKIGKGELVLLNLQAANNDEKVFPNPAEFDTSRRGAPHLTFGHGIHYCIGASLARIELQTVLGTVFQRFPGLRLAIPIQELRQRDDIFTGTLHALPVSW